MKGDDIGRRCAKGCKTWPDETRFSVCPFCREPTRRYRGTKPLTQEKAESERKKAEFEHFYNEQWIKNNDPDPKIEALAGLS